MPKKKEITFVTMPVVTDSTSNVDIVNIISSDFGRHFADVDLLRRSEDMLESLGYPRLFILDNPAEVSIPKQVIPHVDSSSETEEAQKENENDKE